MEGIYMDGRNLRGWEEFAWMVGTSVVSSHTSHRHFLPPVAPAIYERRLYLYTATSFKDNVAVDHQGQYLHCCLTIITPISDLAPFRKARDQ